MTRPSFLGLVPRPVRLAAWIVFGCVLTGALVAGYFFAVERGPSWVILLYGLAAITGGLFLATWLLGLGYIYADARRRAMRPVLWVLIALLLPHLLGFLLYFVLREPVAARCLHCGNTIPAEQRFCSWCGSPQTLSPTAVAAVAPAGFTPR